MRGIKNQRKDMECIGDCSCQAYADPIDIKTWSKNCYSADQTTSITTQFNSEIDHETAPYENTFYQEFVYLLFLSKRTKFVCGVKGQGGSVLL